jgi:hypothetical protein
MIFIGPPLAPNPKFHVVNATHIEVEWDKPFALPEFDVRNYTLSIVNTTSESNSTRNKTFPVSVDTTYPIRYHISNQGDIPKQCVHLNFLLTATNDAGRSDVDSVTGGFPVGKLSDAPIATNVLLYVRFKSGCFDIEKLHDCRLALCILSYYC